MAKETEQHRAQRARAILAKLKKTRPKARLELNFSSPLELLVATVLAAQALDRTVNEVTKTLFRHCRTAYDYANADLKKLEEEIKATGFYHQKAKALVAMGKQLVEKHGAQVPGTMEELTGLHGVARKTANVVLGAAMGIPAGIVVDRHVARVSQRTGLSAEKTPEKIEAELMALLPQKDWIAFGTHYTLHGRYICTARRPKCSTCPLLDLCPQIGVTDAQ
jgi:endonuclease-3